MQIYYLMLLMLGVSSFLSINIKNKKKRNKIIINFSCFMIILVQGLRHVSVGVDLGSYIPAFKYSKYINLFKGNKILNFEMGYSLYSQFFSILNISEQFYLVIVASTIIIPIGYIWIKNSKMPGLSVYIYITLGFFTFSFSGLRQSIALGITFYSYKFIQQKNKKRFLMGVLTAFFFHKSAIIFILAYPLYFIRIRKEKLLIVFSSLSIVYILRTKIYTFLYFLYGGGNVKIEQTNAYTMLFVMITIYILSYIFFTGNDARVNSYRNYMMIAIFIQLFASVSSSIMRAGYYYYIFITLLIPEIISKQKGSSKKVTLTIVIIFLLIFYHLTTRNGYLNVVPYHFFWTV